MQSVRPQVYRGMLLLGLQVQKKKICVTVFEQRQASTSAEGATSSEACRHVEESEEGESFKVESCEAKKEEFTLLHWILAQGNEDSLQDILDYCQKGLALVRFL